MFSVIVLCITLDSAMKRALEYNLQMRAGLYEVESVGYSAKSAWSAVLPVFNANFSHSRQFELPEANIMGVKTKVGTKEQSNISLSLFQSIPLDGSSWSIKRARDFEFKSQLHRFKSMEQELAFSVASLYINIARLKEFKDIALKNIERMKRRLESARELFDAGVILRADLVRFEAAYQDAILQLEETELNLERALMNFSFLLGYRQEIVSPTQSIEELIRIYDPYSFFRKLEVEKEKFPYIVDSADDINSLKYAVQSLGALASAERGRLLPRLSVGFSLLNSFGGFVEQRNIPSLSFGISLNFDFGGTIFSYLALRRKKASLEVQLEDLEIRKMYELDVSIREFHIVSDKVEVARRKLSVSEEAFFVAEQLFDQGKITATELLDYEMQLRSSQMEVKDAQAQLLELMFRTKKIIGDILS